MLAQPLLHNKLIKRIVISSFLNIEKYSRDIGFSSQKYFFSSKYVSFIMDNDLIRLVVQQWIQATGLNRNQFNIYFCEMQRLGVKI